MAAHLASRRIFAAGMMARTPGERPVEMDAISNRVCTLGSWACVAQRLFSLLRARRLDLTAAEGEVSRFREALAYSLEILLLSSREWRGKRWGKEIRLIIFDDGSACCIEPRYGGNGYDMIVDVG